MKHLIRQFILLLFYLVFIDFAQASYSCYEPYAYHNLLIEKDGIYLQETIKDRNKISYVFQSKIRLKGIENIDVRVISDDGSKILVLSNSKYYLIPKSLLEAKEHKIIPLFNKNEVSKTVSNKFFLVSDHWYYVSYTSKGKYVKHKIPELKGNLEIIADSDIYEYLNDNAVLLKDDNAVYVYDISKNKLEKIPHLTPSQTHLFQSPHYKGYLYDDDTFYLMGRNFKYIDITKEFNQQGKYDGFTKAEIHISHSGGDSIDTKDGLIWINIVYFDKSSVTPVFIPVNATYLNAHKDLYVYNNKVYGNWDLFMDYIYRANPFDPSYEDKSFDLSNIQNPSELHQISTDSEFFDNQQYYAFGEDSGILEKIDPSAYLKRLTAKDHIEIREKRIFVDGQQLNTDKFQDKPIFLGSIVDIISPCMKIIRRAEGFDSKPEEDYYYFFTDSKKVYTYINPGENLKPKVLDNVSPQNLKVNDYDTLQKLLNMFKTKAKENN